MTAITPERLLYQGQEVDMRAMPLEDYFDLGPPRPDLPEIDSSLRRGYVGLWEIVDRRLYLIGMDRDPWGRGEQPDENLRDRTLGLIFPNHPNRVFAHWFTGQLSIPLGEVVDYRHHGFASTFERDTLIDVHRGIVAATTQRLNTWPDVFRADQFPDPNDTWKWLDDFPDPPDDEDSDPIELPFAVTEDNLKETGLTVEEVERRERVYCPLDAVPRLPFGFLHPQWLAFLQRQQPGETLSTFTSCKVDGHANLTHRIGYAWARKDQPGAFIVTTVRQIRT